MRQVEAVVLPFNGFPLVLEKDALVVPIELAAVLAFMAIQAPATLRHRLWLTAEAIPCKFLHKM